MTTSTTLPELSGKQLSSMTPEDFMEHLRGECSKPGYGMTDHPIVNEMEAGTVTIPQLQLFTEQFYQHISRMLPWLGMMYVTCPHEEARATLLMNINEENTGKETGVGASHPDLLLRFGEALGLDLDATRATEQLPAGRRLTEYFEFMGFCREWYVPLAAIGIGLESFVPETFSRIVPALKDNYGMTDEQIIFWTMHIPADTQHGDEGIEIVSKYATSAEARKHVFDCTMETSRLFYELWDTYRQA